MTPTLATVDGITRDQAQHNYLTALAQLVTYIFGVDQMALQMFARPDYDVFRYVNRLGPSPEAIVAGIYVQAHTHFQVNPPMVRTIELVGA